MTVKRLVSFTVYAAQNTHDHELAIPTKADLAALGAFITAIADAPEGLAQNITIGAFIILVEFKETDGSQ